MRNRSQTLAGISVANLKVLRYIINVQLLHPLGFHRRVQMRFCGARSRESRNYHPDSVIYQRLFRRVFGFWLKHFKLPLISYYHADGTRGVEIPASHNQDTPQHSVSVWLCWVEGDLHNLSATRRKDMYTISSCVSNVGKGGGEIQKLFMQAEEERGITRFRAINTITHIEVSRSRDDVAAVQYSVLRTCVFDVKFPHHAFTRGKNLGDGLGLNGQRGNRYPFLILILLGDKNRLWGLGSRLQHLEQGLILRTPLAPIRRRVGGIVFFQVNPFIPDFEIPDLNELRHNPA